MVELVPPIRADAYMAHAEKIAQFDDSYRFAQLIDGEVVLAIPTVGHQLIVSRLCLAVMRFDKDERMGWWFPSVNVQLSSYTVVNPDLSFYDRDGLPELDVLISTTQPVMVVEVLSEESRYRDCVSKLVLYANGRIPEYWIVDPDAGVIKIQLLSEDGTYEVVDVARDEIRAGRFAGLHVDNRHIFLDKAFPQDD
jgi:Uma2 family endonuclease